MNFFDHECDGDWPERILSSAELGGALAAFMQTKVQQIIDNVEPLSLMGSDMEVFLSRSAPTISLPDYLQRIVKYADPGVEALLAAKVLIDRLHLTHNVFHLTSRTVHRILVAAILLGAKLTRDRYFTNAHFARVVGVSVEELSSLEMCLFSRLDFRLRVPNTELSSSYHQLCDFVR